MESGGVVRIETETLPEWTGGGLTVWPRGRAIVSVDVRLRGPARRWVLEHELAHVAEGAPCHPDFVVRLRAERRANGAASKVLCGDLDGLPDGQLTVGEVAELLGVDERAVLVEYARLHGEPVNLSRPADRMCTEVCNRTCNNEDETLRCRFM